MIIVWRIFLAVIFCSSIFFSIRAGRSTVNLDQSEMLSRINGIIEENGFISIENPTDKDSVLSAAIYFGDPECAEKQVIMPMILNWEAGPYLTRIIPDSYIKRIFYLDGEWGEGRKAEILFYHFWMKLKSRIYQMDFSPNKVALTVAFHESCTLRISDWSRVWRSRS